LGKNLEEKTENFLEEIQDDLEDDSIEEMSMLQFMMEYVYHSIEIERGRGCYQFLAVTTEKYLKDWEFFIKPSVPTILLNNF
jgi:hypothetical protein